jgi:hypothetical protein
VTGGTVWVANDDVKIYDFNGNYISQFGVGFEYSGDIANVPESSAFLLLTLGTMIARRHGK